MDLDINREIYRLHGRLNFYKEILLVNAAERFAEKPRSFFEEIRKSTIDQMRYRPMPNTGNHENDAQLAQMEKDASDEAQEFFRALEHVLNQVDRGERRRQRPPKR